MRVETQLLSLVCLLFSGCWKTEAERQAEEELRLGSEAFGAGDLDKAMKHANRSLELDGTADAHFLRASVSFMRRDFDTALTDIRSGLELDPDNEKLKYLERQAVDVIHLKKNCPGLTHRPYCRRSRMRRDLGGSLFRNAYTVERPRADAMSFEFENEFGDEYGFNSPKWRMIRWLATEFGWVELGTLPADDWTDSSKVNWDGGYDSNDGQIVSREDALNLANALDALLSSPQFDAYTKGVQSEYSAMLDAESTPKMQLILEHSSAEDWRQRLEGFINFCRQGEFRIY